MEVEASGATVALYVDFLTQTEDTVLDSPATKNHTVLGVSLNHFSDQCIGRFGRSPVFSTVQERAVQPCCQCCKLPDLGTV
jgi:hypothetical protein